MALVLWASMACGARSAESGTATPPAQAPEALSPLLVPSQGLAADLEATLRFSVGRPRYEQPLVTSLAPADGVGSLSAKACGGCHQAIAQEWAMSTHAHAWTDVQYQAELTKSGNRWLCLNCHTPLLAQQDRWPVGLQADDVELPLLVENPAFDAGLRSEGITCAACHVRDGVIHGPGLPDSVAPHPVTVDETLRDNRVCERCHQATATYPGKGFICVFDTGNEWSAGPYPSEDKGCPECHMPTVERPAARGGPVRTVRTHGWRGAGIPKDQGAHPPVAANPPGLALTGEWLPDALSLTLTNARAGHRLPTGDPERWVLVELSWTDRFGEQLGETWQHRIGQTWEWWPEPKKLADNRLAPRESRTMRVSRPAGAVAARIEASSHRMSVETADYHHLQDYPLSVVTHRLVVSETEWNGGVLE